MLVIKLMQTNMSVAVELGKTFGWVAGVIENCQHFGSAKELAALKE